MLEGNYVINLMSFRSIVLVQETVFASFPGAMHNQSAQFIGYVGTSHSGREQRVLTERWLTALGLGLHTGDEMAKIKVDVELGAFFRQ